MKIDDKLEEKIVEDAKDVGRVAGSFLKDLAKTFDLVSIVTFVLFVASVVKLLGLEAALLLGVFYLVRGAGHFWGLRLCNIAHKKMRFIPFLGGYVEPLTIYLRRWDEGFCSIAPSLWVLVTSLLAFSIYLTTGNLTCLMYAWISFAINTLALVPIICDLDGAIIVKSIAFSISRSLGLIFMGVNAVLLPSLLAVVMYLRNSGQIDLFGLIPLLVAGLQRFSEEYYRIIPIVLMTSRQVKILSGVYVSLLACFLVMPKALGISALSIASLPMLWPTIVVGMVGLVLLSALKSNITAFIAFKRGFCGE